jgi:hypothetical protein
MQLGPNTTQTDPEIEYILEIGRRFCMQGRHPANRLHRQRILVAGAPSAAAMGGK